MSKEKNDKKENSNLIEMEDPYFFSLITQPTTRKKRYCLKCRNPFLSAHHGNRVCGSCCAQNKRASSRASMTFEI